MLGYSARQQWGYFRRAGAQDKTMVDVFWCQVQQQTKKLRPHFHDTYALGLIARGLSRYDCGARSFETDSVTAHLINPGEVHTAFPSTCEPISYTTFHVPQDYVRMH